MGGKNEKERGNWRRNGLRGTQHPDQNKVPYKPGSHSTLNRLQQSKGNFVLDDPFWTSEVGRFYASNDHVCFFNKRPISAAGVALKKKKVQPAEILILFLSVSSKEG